MKVAAIQLNSKDNKEENLEKAIRYIIEAAEEGAKLVVLPEYMNFLSSNYEAKLLAAESVPGYTSSRLSEIAKEYKLFIHCGSILEKHTDKKCYNTSFLVNDQGEIVQTYRKIHLFDIEVSESVSFKESNTITPGTEIVTAETPIGVLGLSICYDLRFPELYRKLTLQGAQVIAVPAAFNIYTGIYHWEVLLRARAIENQCYVIAPGQIGTHPENATCFGNSMIIDPWGTVIARATEEEGNVYGFIDQAYLKRMREKIPCLTHRKPALYNN